MRDEIVKYLGTVATSTAKTIAERIGVDRQAVAIELNHMHTDTLVEREKRGGGGNEYVYWLSRKDDVAKLEAAIGAPTPPVEAAKPEVAEVRSD
jgi:predicted transcriptional regulator